jgi:hypothetical protein
MEIIKKFHYHFFFLANHKAENYHDMVADHVQSYTAVGCCMYLQVCFGDSLRLLPIKSRASER